MHLLRQIRSQESSEQVADVFSRPCHTLQNKELWNRGAGERAGVHVESPICSPLDCQGLLQHVCFHLACWLSGNRSLLPSQHHLFPNVTHLEKRQHSFSDGGGEPAWIEQPPLPQTITPNSKTNQTSFFEVKKITRKGERFCFKWHVVIRVFLLFFVASGMGSAQIPEPIRKWKEKKTYMKHF